MKQTVSKALKYGLSLALAALLLFFAFKGVEWDEFFGALGTTRWGFIILSLVPAIIALILRAERWRLLLAEVSSPVSRIRIWDASNIGNFMNVVIPGTGEFIRCGYVCRGKSGYDRAFGTILMERAWDILAIAVLLVSALLVGKDTLAAFVRQHITGPLIGKLGPSILWVALAVLVVAVLAIVLAYAYRGRPGFLSACADAVKGVMKGFTSFAGMGHKSLFLLYTAGIWVMYIFMTFFTLKAVPELQHMTFLDAVFISAVGNIASVIPTPGNLGAYHYIVGLAISSIYLGSGEILTAPLLCATLSHGSHAVLIIVLALISYVANAFRKDHSIE